MPVKGVEEIFNLARDIAAENQKAGIAKHKYAHAIARNILSLCRGPVPDVNQPELDLGTEPELEGKKVEDDEPEDDDFELKGDELDDDQSELDLQDKKDEPSEDDTTDELDFGDDKPAEDELTDEDILGGAPTDEEPEADEPDYEDKEDSGDDKDEADDLGDEEEPEDKEKKKPSGLKDDDWWEKLTVEEQIAYKKEHPATSKKVTHKLEPMKMSELPGALANIAGKGLHKAKVAALNKFVLQPKANRRRTLSAINSLRAGRDLNDIEKKALKKTAVTCGLVLMAAAITAAFFIPGMQNIASIAASKFIEWRMDHPGEPASEFYSDSADDMNEKQAVEYLVDDMQKWLAAMPPKDLEKLLNGSAKEA